MFLITMCSFHYCVSTAISPFMYGWRGAFIVHTTCTAQYPWTRRTPVTQWNVVEHLVHFGGSVPIQCYFAGKFDWNVCGGTFHIPLPTFNTYNGAFSIIHTSLDWNIMVHKIKNWLFKVLYCREMPRCWIFCKLNRTWRQEKCRRYLIQIDYIWNWRNTLY